MATLAGTVHSVSTIKPDFDESGLQIALVLFTISGTYVQADNAKLASVDTLIAASRRNGKTITLVDAMLYQPAMDGTTAGLLLGLKTVAVSTADVTFEITEGATANTLDVSTEYTNSAALPSLATPFGIAVSFIES